MLLLLVPDDPDTVPGVPRLPSKLNAPNPSTTGAVVAAAPVTKPPIVLGAFDGIGG